MLRRTLALAALLLPACSSATDSTDPSPGGGAGGKADEIRPCAEGRTCLPFRSYEVLFTNPLCSSYPYDEPVSEVDGEREIIAKPKNVFCTKVHDSANSAARDSSPQRRALDWIESSGDGDHVFAAYLSFSDNAIATALCGALDRGAEVTFVHDGSPSSQALQVRDCGGELLSRGHVGSVGFAHNKVLMINPEGPGPADADAEFGRISFGSGNMSSGTHLSHENWHFIDVARDSFFWQYHGCLMEALIPAERTSGKTAFRSFMNECRDAIEAPPEDDMQTFMIPVLEDHKALIAEMVTLLEQAGTIDVAAHRFSANDLVDTLALRLEDKDTPVHVRLIADDDLYWRVPLPPSKFTEAGFNSADDADSVRELREVDGDSGRFEEAYLETNHNIGLFQHNKFLIFGDLPSRPDTLLMGSANLTGTGLKDNLENMYVTDIPEVVGAFQAQYRLWWDGEGPLPEGHDVAPRATMADDMPIVLLSPQEPGDTPAPEPTACGIRLAEVLYDAVGSDNGREWIKLYNSCEDGLDLSGMSLGWGGDSYRSGSLDLVGQLEGKSCMIVGGPTTSTTNGSPAIDLVANLTPDLQNSGTTADGVAVFASPAGSIDSDTVPVDAVIYGAANTSGLLDATGEARDPQVRDAASGDTIIRTAEGTWDVGAPTPTACPKF